MNLKPGELLIFSEGPYSDYSIEALFQVLKEFDSDIIKDNKAMFKQYYSPEQDERYWHYKGRLVVNWLLKNGYVKELDYKEINFTDYSKEIDMTTFEKRHADTQVEVP